MFSFKKPSIFRNSYLRHKFPYELESNSTSEVASFKVTPPFFFFLGKYVPECCSWVIYWGERKHCTTKVPQCQHSLSALALRACLGMSNFILADFKENGGESVQKYYRSHWDQKSLLFALLSYCSFRMHAGSEEAGICL